MKVATWNVNGIRAREAQVLEWVQREQPDVLCLQEIKASPEHVPAALCELPGYSCRWHGYKGYSGVGLHVRRTLGAEPRFFHPPFDKENRAVMVELGALTIASLYVPNGGKDFDAKMEFLRALDAFVEQAHAQGRAVLLCGDMNVAREERDVHPTLRNPEQIGQTAEERWLFERILSRGLTDLGRHFAPDDDALYTWWAPWRNMRGRNRGWRLDYVLASDALARRALGCVAFRDFGTSDHGPVVATFSDEAPAVPLESGSGVGNGGNTLGPIANTAAK